MIFRSPHPATEIPATSLTEFIFSRAARHADKAAIVDGASGRALTYARLGESIERAAAGLARRGFTKGDVLAVFSPNVPEYVIAFHAAATLGGVVTTINPLYTVEEVAHQLSDAGARWLVTVPQLMEKAVPAAGQTGAGELFVFGEAEGATPFAALLAEGGVAPRAEVDAREDVVALPYSSGTTGVAKGVMLTHRNCVANLLQFVGAGYDFADETLVCVLPLFHIYGLQAIMHHGLYCGATIVTLPRFDFDGLLQTVETYRVSTLHIVPPIVLALAKKPEISRYDLTSVRMIFSGAAPLSREISRAVAKRLGCHVKQGYGMTETSPVTHLTPRDPAQARPGAVGHCVPNTECKIVSVETGEELDAGERGEICVRGPQVMKGYLNKPDATARTIDADGWLHTGDIGYTDDEGHFYIVDRAKELIKYKGFQVAPAELEALLLTHPQVADAAVIPSPDEEAGEVPKAFIVRRDGGEVSAEEIISFVAGHVAPHKKVRRVEFVAQIPKSPSGKILRRVLVARERERGLDGN